MFCLRSAPPKLDSLRYSGLHDDVVVGYADGQYVGVVVDDDDDVVVN